MAACNTFRPPPGMRPFSKPSCARGRAGGSPRIGSATRVSLRAPVRRFFRTAMASVSPTRRSDFGLPMALGPLHFLVGGMAVEGARRREFAEAVTHHVFGHQDRHELVSVVDAEGQPDELRQDRGPS